MSRDDFLLTIRTIRGKFHNGKTIAAMSATLRTILKKSIDFCFAIIILLLGADLISYARVVPVHVGKTLVFPEPVLLDGPS